VPTFALIGRPNVGKSLLFNRLIRRDISLVHDRPGVTRDRIVADTRFRDVPVTVIDTGGIAGPEHEFREAIEQEAALARETADVLLWITDGREGVTPSDLDIARQLRRARKPVLIVVNKLDEPPHPADLAPFARLGFGTPLAISAAHRRGLDDLIAAALEALPPGLREAPDPDAPRAARPTRLAFVGRPNVGKSSLINAILQDRRTIVSAIAGTTRDAIEIPYARTTAGGEQPFLLVDTAGMRQRRRIHDDLEASMTGRTAHAIKRSDVCVLVLEADTGVGMQDKKIAGLVHDAGKACLIAVNKWDLAAGVKWRRPADDPRNRGRPQSLKGAFEEALRKELYFLNYAPILFVSAKEGSDIPRLFEGVDTVAENLRRPIPTAPLNAAIQRAFQKQPPPLRGGRRFKILYAAPRLEEGAWLSPEIIAFCNDRALLPDFWLQYLEGSLRDEFALAGCPIRWQWRERDPRRKTE
jgi:GTP-binding protein